jgi:beta-glucuronidase
MIDMLSPHESTTRERISLMHHRVFDRIDEVVGEHVRNFADFATRPGISRVDGNKKGVFTRERRPKASAHALRRRWHGET